MYIKLLFTWCERLGVDFLPFYAASGLWCALFVVVAAAADFATLARHAGRFTEELLAALVSFIFMYSALVEVRGAAAASREDDVLQLDTSSSSSSSSSTSSTSSSSSSSPDVFLKHLLLFFGTFAAARQVETSEGPPHRTTGAPPATTTRALLLVISKDFNHRRLRSTLHTEV